MSAIRRFRIRREVTSGTPQAILLVLVLGAAGLVAVILLVLVSRTSAAGGTNGVRPVGFYATLPGGSVVCDAASGSRPGVDAVEMTIGLDGRPPQPVALQAPGGRPGPVVPGADAVVGIPLPPGTSLDGGRLCRRNLGR